MSVKGTIGVNGKYGETSDDIASILASHYYEQVINNKTKLRTRLMLGFSLAIIAIGIGFYDLIPIEIAAFCSAIIIVTCTMLKVKTPKPVLRIGKCNLDYLVLPYKDKSVVLDADYITGNMKVTYPYLKDDNSVIQKVNVYESFISELYDIYPNKNYNKIDIKDLSESYNTELQSKENFVNDIKGFYNRFDFDNKYFNVLSSIQQDFSEINEYSENVPFVQDEGVLKYLTNNFNKLEKNSISEYTEKQKSLLDIVSQAIGMTKDNSDIDEYLQVKYQSIEKNSEIMREIIKSLDQIIFKPFMELNNITFSKNFNYYCPYCNDKLLIKIQHQDKFFDDQSDDNGINFNENTKMKYNLTSKKWHCSQCERETNIPIPIYKTYDECILPAYNILLMENYKERLQNYNNIYDQKTKYKNEAAKEIEQLNMNFRKERESIETKINEISAHINSNIKNLSQVESLMTRYNAISEERLQEVDAHTRTLKQDIVGENEKAISESRSFVEAQSRELESQMENFAQLAKEEDVKKMALMQNMADGIQKTADNTSSIADDTKNMREIEEVRAERSGMNKKQGFRGVGKREREKERKK